MNDFIFDEFLSMPIEAQLLYFHLRADAINNGSDRSHKPKAFCKLLGFGMDMLDVLEIRGLVEREGDFVIIPELSE